jgi:hypothetical protein
VVEPLDCAVVVTSSSPSVTSQLLSTSNNININNNTIIINNNNDTTNSTTLSEEEMITDHEGRTHHISTATVDLSLDDTKRKKRYSAIRWGDYRTKRFLGDFRDEGDEIQIEHFQKA